MSGDTATDATTFTELLNGSGPKAAACRRCGEQATHRVHLAVREKPAPGSGRAQPPTVADHKSDMCERCAVQLFAQVRKAMR